MTNRIVFLLAVSVIYAAVGCNSGSQAPSQSAPSTPQTAPKPFAASDYRVVWISHQIPSEMQSANDHRLTVSLENAGQATWQSGRPDVDVVNKVFVSYHWLPAQGDTPTIINEHRTPLPQDLGPGQTITVNNVVVTAPSPGSYRLQITLVHEGVVWFESMGAKTLIVPVKVI